MSSGNRNLVLNCRVTQNTLDFIDSLRYDSPRCSRADIIEDVFRILSKDIEYEELRRLIYYRSHYRFKIPEISLRIANR